MRALWICGLCVAWLSASSARADSRECAQAHQQAQVFSKQGQLLQAREQMLRCARADCPDLIVEDCAGWLPALESRIPTAVFAVSDELGRDVTEITVNDQQGRVIASRADGRAVELDPGMYVLRFTAAGFNAQEARIVVREAEKSRILRIVLRPLTSAAPASHPAQISSRTIPLASYILAGVALGGGAVFAYAGLRSNALASRFDERGCSSAATNSECQDLASSGELHSNVANISLAVGVASLGAAVLIYALTPPTLRPADAPLTSLTPMRGGALLQWGTRF